MSSTFILMEVARENSTMEAVNFFIVSSASATWAKNIAQQSLNSLYEYAWKPNYSMRDVSGWKFGEKWIAKLLARTAACILSAVGGRRRLGAAARARRSLNGRT